MKRSFTNKRTTLIITLIIFIIAIASNVYANTYVGSARSDKFHYSWCRAAKRINPNNIVYFSSRQDALDSGYVSCGICHP